MKAAVLFPIVADLPGAQRCPHKSGITGRGRLHCEKPTEHHLADYPGSHECAARTIDGTWRFWTVRRQAPALLCLSAMPDDQRIVCRLPAGHDHTSTHVHHLGRAENGRNRYRWIEERPALLLTGRAGR